jgi:hypothetical protein
MSRAKALLGLAVICGALLTTIVPASAWFESNLKATNHGPGIAGTTVFTAKGVPITCTGAKGEWAVVDASKQVETKFSTHDLIKIPEAGWEGCTGPLGTTVSVSSFNIQLKQPTKAQKLGLTAQIIGTGMIRAGNCKIEFTEAGNSTLKEVTAENEGTTDLVAHANVSGISYIATGTACEGLGITTAATAELKIAKLLGESEKLI